jgi:transcriptional regulator with XRE-family HTH domain
MPRKSTTRPSLARYVGRMARQMRTKADLTQREMAARVGLATEVYGRMERGQLLPSVPTLLRVCGALGIDANTLLGFDSRAAPAWLAPTPFLDDQPPELRHLLFTARKLAPRQLKALRHVASAMVPASGAQSAPPRGEPQAEDLRT